ncbi:MAG TPA: type VI secretion system baseplate subunit TssF [Rhodothermales bacterium]|nr:type VI secretion system baseplate subunit TssF [Rhodothermales bacterium]
MLRRYFEDEMRALQEGGREFARLYPELARALHPESQADRDPHVERLFEGFAFLVGRVRERLDDELPEYTEGLCRLLYPHYLRPIPAMTVVEFAPRPGLLQETTVVEAGFEVRSAPVGEERTTFRFTTTAPVRLQPLRLADVRVAWPTPATSTLTIRFDLERGAEWKKLALSPLGLFFGVDPGVAATLRLFLSRDLAGVTVRSGAWSHELGAASVRLAERSGEGGVLPAADTQFPGFRLLQEYLAFRPRFAFADVHGLGGLALPEGARSLELELRFARALPHDRPLTAESIRLFCAPAVNLFTESVEPVRVEHRQSEYPVVADVARPKSVEVYDLVEVEGIVEATGQRFPYASFQTFAWPSGRFYEELSRPGPDGRRRAYVAVGGEAADDVGSGPVTLSITARCTNGDLPHDALPEGTLSRPGPGASNLASFRNLGRPTHALRPPLDAGEEFLWRLVAYLALNRASIGTAPALSALLALHDWSGDPANRRRVGAVRSVAWRPAEALFRGGIVRGADVAVEVEDEPFLDDGDLHLFGAVLSAVLADYATINSFVHLDLTARPSGRHFRWTPRTGTQPLL